ncbi:vacuolar protein sorting-associated protein 41 homolog isoform X2 [Hydra vulgaris]|uniref:Vacuolar protein sorting-associated protein 41 homolog n=1 Tax=Hydra vulgaris TaxID=6087 RepID=A0ABM4CTL1_HYDVU
MSEKNAEDREENSTQNIDDNNEDDNDEKDNVEPKLKYERIGNSIPEIFTKDVASCMAVHSKFLALGTHYGVVHILDHQGNNIRKFPSHATTINQIAIDSNGDYVSSCSEDGRFIINGLYTTENNTQLNFDCPIRSIGLHPDFGRRGNKQYVIGVGEKLTLFEKGWMRNKSVILHSGEGFVRSIKWKNNFIAWANSEGVQVYDINAKERITHIPRDQTSARDELFHCNLYWKDNTCFFVAWGNSIKVCIVKERPANDIRSLPRHFVEIAHIFDIDYFASGIAPFGNEMAVLAYSFDEEDGAAPTKGTAKRPQLLVIKPEGMYKFEEASNDCLSIRGFEEYKCNNYFLEKVEEEQLFYIVSPKDIVIARPRDLDDHISWLMENKKFEAALQKAENQQRELKRLSVLEIVKAYLNYLFADNEFEKAAILCDRKLGGHKDLWEVQIYKFIEKKALKTVTRYIPLSNPQFDNTIYELVLNEYLQTDLEGFYKLLTEWPNNLYKPETIIMLLQEKIRETPESILLQSLATLYAHKQKFGEALKIYLTLGHPGVFEMIAKHKLLSWVKDKCLPLMEIESNKAVAMFIDNIDHFEVDDVVKQLNQNPKLLHQYLHGLFTKNPQAGQKYHNKQIALYAEFQPDRLQFFLKNSNFYQLEKAFKVCQERKFISEMVFLQGRMGNKKEALSLIIDEMCNIQKAIDFAKEENDPDLWDYLIEKSLPKPEYIKELLISIGTHINPKLLIKKIPSKMEIPGLRDALVKILQDYNLQVYLYEGCKAILDKDSVALYDKQVKNLSKGFLISDIDDCPTCKEKLIVEDNRKASTIVIFFCKHAHHEVCPRGMSMQPRQSVPFCTSCSSKTSKKKI